jgi:hypothetical protein
MALVYPQAHESSRTHCSLRYFPCCSRQSTCHVFTCADRLAFYMHIAQGADAWGKRYAQGRQENKHEKSRKEKAAWHEPSGFSFGAQERTRTSTELPAST